MARDHKTVALILERMKAKKPMDEPDGDEEGSSMAGLDTCCEEMCSALQEGDAQALKRALMEACRICCAQGCGCESCQS